MTIVYVILAVVVLAFAVDAFNRHRIRNLRQSGLYPPADHGGAADVERLVALGRKNDAIKLYREINRTDLKTAKEGDRQDRGTSRPSLTIGPPFLRRLRPVDAAPGASSHTKGSEAQAAPEA